MSSLLLVAALLAPLQSPDSLAVRVAFVGTGGSVTSKGLFTSGSTAGTFRVIAVAKAAGVAETSSVIIPGATPASTASTGSPLTGTGSPGKTPTVSYVGKKGIPFGSFGGWDGSIRRSNTENFTLGTGAIDPDEVISRISAARGLHQHLLLSMTGGAHRNYKTDGVFDMAKWKAKMDRYNTAPIQAAVAAAVADGTIIGNSVMDEPQNTSADNSWGPPGTMTKARVDEMCGYVKGMFPTMPVGVVHDHRVFQPDVPYHTCDFIVTQYRWAKTKGDIAQFRDDALALGKRDGIAIAFSLNILDGGIPREKKDEPCPVPETGGDGTMGKACRMTSDQIREWGLVLGPAGCALTMWRYDPIVMADPKNIQAFKDIGAALSQAQARSCGRP
jgi:hypothetical protein